MSDLRAAASERAVTLVLVVVALAITVNLVSKSCHGITLRTHDVDVSLRLDSLPLGRRLGIHEELRIGGEMGDQPLGTVGQVLVGKEMSLVVSQPALSQVLIFDSLGQLSATLGRRGDGPGEFRDLLSIGTLGDTLYVTDRGRQRVTYFRDGQLLGSRRWIADIAPRSAGSSGLRLHPNVPEVIVGENRALVRPNLAMSAPETEREVSVHVPIWLVNGESQVLSTPVWDDMSRVSMSVRYRGAVFQAVAPLQPEPFTRLSPGGNGAVTVSYPSGRLTLTGIEPFGDTVFVRELGFAPIPLSDSRIRRAVLDMWIFPEPPEGKEEPIRSAFEKEFRGSEFLPEYFSTDHRPFRRARRLDLATPRGNRRGNDRLRGLLGGMARREGRLRYPPYNAWWPLGTGSWSPWK